MKERIRIIGLLFFLLLALLFQNANAAITPLSAGNPGVSPASPTVGQPVTFTAAASGGSGGDSYQWYYGPSQECQADIADPGQISSTYSTTLKAGTFYCYSVTDSEPATAFSQVYPFTFISQYAEFDYWLPVMFLAVMLSITIVGIYYILGMLLNNKRVKNSAVSELTQAIGTGVMLVIIIGVLILIGTGEFSFVGLIDPSSMNTVCNQLKGSQVNMIQNGGVIGPLSNSPNPITFVCSATQSAANLNDITDRLNYGLYASYIIIANLTDQSAANLNSFYLFEGWIGFLSSFQAVTQICSPPTCFLPITPRPTNIKVTYSPLAGYSMLTQITQPVESEAGFSFYILFMQLTIITLLLYAWPYVLAAGVVLRSTFFTRKLGGLLMAIALSSLLIYPVMYMTEYNAFTNSNLIPIGSESLPSIPLYQQQQNGYVTIYGTNTIGGYVPALMAPRAGCPYPIRGNPTDAYEYQCGNPDSGGKDVKGNCPSAPGIIKKDLCPTSGYVPAIFAPKAGCPNGEWAYESTCFDGNTASGCALTAPIDTNGDAENGYPDLCLAQLGSNINFFIMPHADQVLRYYSCWPGDTFGGLTGQELAFALPYLTPIPAIVNAVQGLVGSLPGTPLDTFNGCTQARAISSVLALSNMYGITFVSSIFTLILNALIGLAGIAGLATIFGGDTSILGLGRLI